MIDRFYLGTHRPAWLELLELPLFVSHRTVRTRTRLPRSRAGWALDSGGFSELRLHGRWATTPREYVAAIRRYRGEIGGLEWAAPQDWMCEPDVLRATGLTVTEHLARTVANYLELRGLAPELPIVPVLQGWPLGDYHRCADLYGRAGVDLSAAPIVGVGSICRRQATTEIEAIVGSLAADGLRLHGFGVKAAGLSRYGQHLVSADSMAWSRTARAEAARRGGPADGCARRSCANCAHYALAWQDRVLRRLTRLQLTLPLVWGWRTDVRPLLETVGIVDGRGRSGTPAAALQRPAA
jgi:hypothetical protein